MKELAKSGAWLLTGPSSSSSGSAHPPGGEAGAAFRAAAAAPAPEPAEAAPGGEAGATFRAAAAAPPLPPLPSLLDWDEIREDPVELRVFTIALEAITLTQALQYRDYQRYAVGRGGARVLRADEWSNVTTYALHLSDELLDDYLFQGRELAREVHQAVREKSLPGWEECWPHGFHVDRVRAHTVDSAWPAPGYTSIHGVTHIQDFLTQLLLAVCHLTKEKDTQNVSLRAAPQHSPLCTLP